MKIMTNVIVTDLTAEDIADILSFESGGFDYWAETCPDELYEIARKEVQDKKALPGKPCYEDVLAQLLLYHGGLTIYDREEDTEYLLTADGLRRGVEQYMNEFHMIDPDDWDAESGDCILQFALFGEIVYG